MHSAVLSLIALCLLGVGASVSAQTPMVPFEKFQIDVHEVTVKDFRQFLAATRNRSAAQKAGVGRDWDGKQWVAKKGLNFTRPHGLPAAGYEPAVHVTWDEAKAYCEWAGKRLPTDLEWMRAAYIELRATPPVGFTRGKQYNYPTGEASAGSNLCDATCKHEPRTYHSDGFTYTAPVARTRPGVNGLYDMAGNAAEWVDAERVVGVTAPVAGSSAPLEKIVEKIVRGGSWADPPEYTHRKYVSSQLATFSSSTIGFRCAKER